jgi:glycine/D-amino acid oxidase-like deaminating enzyme
MIDCEYLVIGGGFFGSYLACLLRAERPHSDVVLLEREPVLISRASYNNQARIHNGYHYPRSFLTAYSSRRNFDTFVLDFKPCVVDDFQQYYAVARRQSKVTSAQFRTFCERIEAPAEVASPQVKALFNADLVEDVFLTREHAFDAAILRELMAERLRQAGVQVRYRTEATRITRDGARGSRAFETAATDLEGGTPVAIRSARVMVCTYSNINTVLRKSGLELIDLKQELTEMPLVTVPAEFEGKGVTVMCGPFFSIMPFPPARAYSIHHVRYTPHYYWHDRQAVIDNQEHFDSARTRAKTRFPTIRTDVARYLPCMAQATRCGSIWEVKTILPRNDNDDGRPILLRTDVGGLEGLTCIMGGKIDNVYDLRERIGGLA